MRRSFRIAICGLFLAPLAGAQVWVEAGDAPSFPDGEAQRTFTPWILEEIGGSLDQAVDDRRDAYCIRIVEPAAFVATTQAMTLDTRLFLFSPDGAPLLANDEASGSEPGPSILRSTATDGSGFTLDTPGEYLLVVTGQPDEPRDKTDLALFGISGDPFAIHAANPLAGSFMEWVPVGPGNQSDSYTVILEGVEPCGVVDMVISTVERNRVCRSDGSGGFSGCSDVSEDEGFSYKAALGDLDGDGFLDAVFAMNLSEPNRVCDGNGAGGFVGCSEVSSDAFDSTGVALGDVNRDGRLDAVFANEGDPSRVCLGDGSGGFVSCATVSNSTGLANAVALGDLDGDGQQDAVLANANAPNQACLGDGASGFSDCVEISADTHDTFRLALGQIDGDGLLDAIFANTNGADRVCFGDGAGEFSGCADVGVDATPSYGVALGDVDGDRDQDAVFAVVGSANRVCLGDGSGGFTCAAIGADTESAFDVALGHVDQDGHLDALFGRTHGPERVCLGDGTGAFSCADVSADSMLAAGVTAGTLDLRLGKIFYDSFETGDKSAWSRVIQ